MNKKPSDDELNILLKRFGRNIRIRRNDLGLSQQDLAEGADIDTWTISSYENGLGNATIKNIIAVARVLGCSSKDLMPD